MRPVVTEQTSKRYKGFMLLGGVFCCVGVIAFFGENPIAGAFVFLGGLITYLWARAAAWWNHG